MAEVQPVFVTIDPDRDTPEKLEAYLKEFHPRLVGLTGTNEQVKKAAKTFRVYFSKPIEDDSDDYLVDHTIIMYLMDPEWNFTAYYGQFMTAQEMADDMVKKVAEFNSDK
jgi:protein SCO1/2